MACKVILIFLQFVIIVRKHLRQRKEILNSAVSLLNSKNDSEN